MYCYTDFYWNLVLIQQTEMSSGIGAYAVPIGGIVGIGEPV